MPGLTVSGVCMRPPDGCCHFTRVFTRFAGVSPARWRERERDGVRQDIVLRPGFINQVLTLPAEHSARQLNPNR